MFLNLIWAQKSGPLIGSMKLLSPEAALYLYKPIIRPCLKYCRNAWASAPSCYLDMLDKLQKRIYRFFGPSLSVSLEPLAHRQNVSGRCLSGLA